MASEVCAMPGFCVRSTKDSHAHYVDNVLQSTMMWLFITIAYLMCGSEKSGASPEVSMDIVSPDFSPFFSVLGMQATNAAIGWAGYMISTCVSSPGFGTRVLLELLSPCAYVYGDLWQIFMREFGPSQQLCNTAVSGLELRYICHPTLHRITESQNGRGWKGPLWVIQSNPPAEAGSPTVGCRGPCPGRS